MKFSWVNDSSERQKVRFFLARKGVSHRMFSQIKNNGGSIEVDGRLVYTSDFIDEGQTITITMPNEISNQLVEPDFTPLEIVYVDDNWLLVNKPAGQNTVPGHADRLHSLVNQVKGYLETTNAENQVPHVITRLDRDTSGLVLLAKHKFAHALLDAQLQEHQVDKRYYVFVNGDFTKKFGEHGLIDQPIARLEGDFIKREVNQSGRASQTEFWVQAYSEEEDITFLTVKLHTGRTHQIRVHFSYLGFPLVGDQLYGGQPKLGINRQALHAYKMVWYDNFIDDNQSHQIGLPEDLIELTKLFNI